MRPIVKQGLQTLELELERDSAKSRPLVDEVKRISVERKAGGAAG